MGELILILGGARSGKSALAQRLALEWGEREVLFVATAEAGDEEMRTRIAAHRAGRPAGWRTLEAPRDVGAALQNAIDTTRVVVVDCLTLLVTNVLLAVGEEPTERVAEQAVAREIEALLAAWSSSSAHCIVVSNEVGLGLVPPYPLGRLFRDLLGRANQMVAARADRVYWMVAGLPVDLKALAITPPRPSEPDVAGELPPA